jgi:hypothetical protein
MVDLRCSLPPPHPPHVSSISSRFALLPLSLTSPGPADPFSSPPFCLSVTSPSHICGAHPSSAPLCPSPLVAYVGHIRLAHPRAAVVCAITQLVTAIAVVLDGDLTLRGVIRPGVLRLSGLRSACHKQGSLAKAGRFWLTYLRAAGARLDANCSRGVARGCLYSHQGHGQGVSGCGSSPN